MALIAYVAAKPVIDPNYELDFMIFYFDDNDPLNTGIDATHPPTAVIRAESWTFPPTLGGAALQTALRDKILERGALLVRARTAQTAATSLLPVGALVTIPGG